MRARPASSNRISFAAMFSSLCFLGGRLFFDDAEDVILAHDEMIDAVDLDVVAAVLAEQDAIALLHRQGAQLALVVGLAAAHRHNLALGGFLLGAVGDDDPALGLLFLGDAANQDAILQRTD